MGYDWRSTTVRFFIVIDGIELTLWTLADANLIPQVPLQVKYWAPSLLADTPPLRLTVPV